MLDPQRDLFDIPRDVAYFNAAGWSPIPKAVAAAGEIGARRKMRPWELSRSFFDAQYERARAAAARVINAEPADIALISSVGYGVATAARGLHIPEDARVLVVEDDHSSPVLEWSTRAQAGGFTVETVRRPGDGDWTAAVLDAIERRGAPPVAVASMSSVHWSDGGTIDMDRVAPAVRDQGGATVIDATHAAGILDLDVTRLDPDYLIFPTYKWLLGPYGRAFLYVSKRRQDSTPLEQTAYGRRDVVAEHDVYYADTRYVEGARRFDMGERDHFISLEMAALGMEYVTDLGRANVEGALTALTDRISERLAEFGNRVSLLGRHLRAPHLLSLGFPRGMPDGLVERLAQDSVYAAPRIGRLRISPHVYNDDEDVDRLVAALKKVVA